MQTFTVHKPMQWRRSVNAFLMALEVAYIFVISTTFEPFGCFEQVSVVSIHPDMC